MVKLRSLKIMAFLIALCITASCGLCYVSAETISPNANGVYEISTYEQLCTFADLVNGTGIYSANGAVSNASAILTSSVTANEDLLNENGDLADGTFKMWNPIENFSGTFNGNGYYITGLYIDGSENNQGLFSTIENSGIVKNLGVYSSYICGADSLGIIAGTSYGEISNCFVSGNVFALSCYFAAGGIVGASYGNIYGCDNSATVFAVSGFSNGEYTGYSGGIAGACNGVISGCANYGEIINTDSSAGGICGKGAEIINSYNRGPVTGVKEAGGIAGQVNGKVENCYHLGEVFVNVDTEKSGSYGAIAGVAYINSEKTVEEYFLNNYYNGVGVIGVGKYVLNESSTTLQTDVSGTINTDENSFLNGSVAYKLGSGYGMIIGSDTAPIRADGYNEVYYIDEDIVCDNSTLYGVVDGYANSSLYVIANEGYAFVGWFSGENCVSATPWIPTQAFISERAEVLICEKGDLNGDGSFNAKDVIRCKKMLVSGCGIWHDAADVNSDGNVDESDLALVIEKVNG